VKGEGEMIKLRPHHAAMFVSDMDKTVAWWKDILGFEKKYEGKFFLPDYGEARMFWIDCGSILVEFMEFKGLEKLDKKRYWKEYGAKHVSFCLENFDEFDDFVKMLEEKGVNITVRATHTKERLAEQFGPEYTVDSKVVFIDDPDGNTVEIMQNTPVL
jgi:catechol 2,3-dioxygenase-like lactoylglutathione lyase family enzyme